MKTQKGFSPVEIILVIVVVVVLAITGSLAFNRVIKASAVKCGTQNCIEQKFATCSPAVYSVDSHTALGSVEYHIYGKKTSGCSMKFVYTKALNPAWSNQPITCLFNNSKPLLTSLGDAFDNVSAGKNDFHCTGPLVALLRKPTTEDASTNDGSAIQESSTLIPGIPDSAVSPDFKKIPYGQPYLIGDGNEGDTTLLLKINKVIVNPQVEGGSPSAGMEYLEVDMDVTNKGTIWTFPVGNINYLIAGGKEIENVYDFGNNGGTIASISIPGKLPLDSLTSIDPGQTKTFYYVFEVPKRSSGSIILNDGLISSNLSSGENPVDAVFSLQ